jgi:hypothetical protein
MFETIRDKLRRDKDYPTRVFELECLGRVLDGKLYDVLKRDFHEERNDSGEYIPLAQRRPSVRYPMCRLVVEDSVSLLFGDGRFPSVLCPDKAQAHTLTRLIAETHLATVMNDAAIRGSVGSIAIRMKVLQSRVFFAVMQTTFLTPQWNPDAPDMLQSVTERYKLRGDVLAANGYVISKEDLLADFWFQRQWTYSEEVWFLPLKVGLVPDGEKPEEPVRDDERSVAHNLGFVPIVWIKNLPGGSSTGDDADGICTFRCAIETQIEIEYQLSQGGRGLKYSSDPTLLIKEPAGDGSTFVKSADNALVVSKDGDAKLLEIGGTAVGAVIEYARYLREMALEGMHGNRASAEKLVVAQSGKAMELMHQALIWLSARLRTSYGDDGLLELLRMVARVRKDRKLVFRDGPMDDLPAPHEIKLRWQPWFDPTTQDDVQQAQALSTLRAAGVISRESAVDVVAENYDIADPQGEVSRIQTDQVEEDARTAAQAAQVKATETIPS